MYKKSIFVFFILICINLLAEPISKEGKIQDVVLYRNQALVTRVIELDLKEGSHEITISKLPSELI
ncbi:MAG TPA: DUF4140 domain-containing protein, partial [Leptospiraceae bacterium]|nr:DUF4140 domain-containing protein [Leptospiraceae bacterium]